MSAGGQAATCQTIAQCAIVVAGGGVVAPCKVFDTRGNDFGGDYLTMPDGSHNFEANCPSGAILAAGQTVRWRSDGPWQGNEGDGLPPSESEAGGGWQICFA